MSYLDGATPTRLGPRPRKSERAPSLSKINLRGEKEKLIEGYYKNSTGESYLLALALGPTL